MTLTPRTTTSLLEDLIFDVQQASAMTEDYLDIISFVDKEIDKDAWGIDLNLNQRAILKAYYKLNLTVEEQSFLESLKLSEQMRTTWDLNSPNAAQYLVLECGRRGSKSALASVIVAYEFYKLCHIPKPQKHYGIGANTPITLLILATTAEQAKGTIYAQICGLFKYVKYFEPLISKKLLVIGAEEILYKSKLLSIKSGNSKSSSQVGYSIICLVMDEVARMEGSDAEEEENPSALSMWANLGASGISFGKDARRLALSSAWFEGDPIQKLYEFAESDPTYIGFRLATWDLNPKYGRDNPIVASAYNSNPRLAALEYEGIRSNSSVGFFESDEVVKCFTGDTAIVTSFAHPDHRETLTIEKVVPAQSFSCGYLDPAITKDSYTFAFGRKELNLNGQLIYYVDGVLVWEPSPNRKVSIVHVQECIKQVHKSRRIHALGADHHNSAETVERLNLAGISARVYTATNPLQVAQYTFAKELMRESRLILPRQSPWRNKLQDELCRVLLIKGVKIDHPRSGCFTGDTKVVLKGGMIKTLSELATSSKSFECLSFNIATRKYEVKPLLNPRVTKQTKSLLKITLENGKIIKCTPEHLFLLKSGTYKEAQYLTQHDDLQD